MELVGRVKTYDQKAKPHEFNVYRRFDGYIVQLDGAEVARTEMHLDALQVIIDLARSNGWHRGPGT